jgi:trans-aconitate methyltransferase
MDKNENAVNIFNKMAQGYQDKFMNVDLYADTLDFFCKSIKIENAEVLELACGPGNITQYLLNKHPDFKLLGTDLAPNMIELAKINNPTAQFEIMDCRKISELNKKYNGIMCGFCLPYLSKEEAIQLISDAAKLLKPKGLLYISTMEDDYNKSAFKKGTAGDEIFMHYHQGAYLTHALQINDLKILKLKRQDYPTQDDTQTTDLIIIAEK